MDQACAGNDELKNQIIALLEVDAEGMTLLIENRLLAGEEQAYGDPHKAIGTRIGPYRLDKLIGEGGMGEVYLAHRDDEQYEQRVALKRVRPSYRSREMLARFRVERQVLARLMHPNITQLLDGGIDQEGRPYLVMQYIEGVSITTFCDTHRLSIEERLQLFRVVCGAVQHAHQNLVVHRDLKPSNILVTEDGDVKLLDFGIAKLLNPETIELSMPITQSQMLVMTPEYAAPEQVKGDVITTSTDVYALGILLYELLTGRRPYQIKKNVYAELERIICREAPAKPSTALIHRDTGDGRTVEQISDARRTGVSRLRRVLQGDLDNIVMMALRKEPERRYVSAEQFSEDISRFLSGRTVSAQKDTLRYRVSKFVKRNRIGVGVGAFIVVMSLAFAFSSIRQARAIAAERDRVQVEAEKAVQMSSFLIDLFEGADPNQSGGDPVTVEQILREGAKKVETALKDQPEVQADMMLELGEVHNRLGLYDESIDLFEKATEIRASLFGSDHVFTANSMVRIGEALLNKGEFNEAEQFLHKGLSIQRKATLPEQARLAATLNGLAIVAYQRKNLDSAEVYITEAVEVRRRTIDQEEGELLLIKELSGLASVQIALQKDSLASLNLEEALRIARDTEQGNHIILAAVLNTMGHLKLRQKKYEEAADYMLQALDMRRELFGMDHPSIPVLFNNLAMVYKNMGDLDNAERYSREGVERQRKVGGAVVGRALMNYGDILINMKRYEQAESTLLESLQILRDAHGDENPLTKRVRQYLVDLYTAWGKPEQATAYQEV